jgi:hypothetical protein
MPIHKSYVVSGTLTGLAPLQHLLENAPHRTLFTCTRADRDAGWNDLPFRDGWNHAALERAAAAANGKDIRGEHLFDEVDLVELGYRPTEHVPTEKATHVVFARQG